ncbi:MAG TPA: hypothetical protein VM580_20225 [Labilithrix sp.]|nr:hypothetical protein [Labilithrix sp.]
MRISPAFYGVALFVLGAACGSTGNGDGSSSGNADGGNSNAFDHGDFDAGGADQTESSVKMYPELWYWVDQLLVRVELDADGKIANIQSSTVTTTVDSGQSAITMLKDGSLLMSRLSKTDDQSHFFHVPNPPRDGNPVTPTSLGVMPDKIMIEGLYTDCEGRVYAMDTGTNDTNSQGNRLLRLTGNIAAGDFTFTQVSDLASAATADIDDMGPGINSDNKIVDNPGLAIDTGHIYVFNFETGEGHEVAQAGTYGIHALGGSLFGDQRSRLYVMNNKAEFFELDPKTHAPSASLGKGPKPAQGDPGWSSLAGPLTDCAKSGFVTQPK